MNGTIGIRREDKNRWERRVPLTPEAMSTLIAQGLTFTVQSSPIRAYPDSDFSAVGATIDEDLSACNLVMAVKEIPISMFRPNGAYLFFSHTVKGQKYNRAMLRRMVELRCTLMDYERIVDENNRRLVFFGWYAGVAGMIDTLSMLGQRLSHLGHDTPLADIQLTHEYADQADAEAAIARVGERLRHEPLPAALCPFVCGFAGYGNVSQGAQRIYDLLPVEEISPADLAALTAAPTPPRDRLFKVVFREEHLVKPRAPHATFDLQEYYTHPERYEGIFEEHLRHLSLLMNGIYWTEAYPRLITREWLVRTRQEGNRRLLAVGDVSCDIEGAIECTLKATHPDVPAYIYDAMTDDIRDGVEGPGIPVMAVDNLPCELPREASQAFSDALVPLVPAMARADYSLPTDELDLPASVKRALVLHNGEFTPAYAYMRAYL